MSDTRRRHLRLVFHLTMTLGLTARLGAEMAMEKAIVDVAWFTFLLAWSVHLLIAEVEKRTVYSGSSDQPLEDQP